MEQIEAALEIAGPDLLVSSQPQYSMLWQAPEAEVFPIGKANGISQIVWSPLAEGEGLSMFELALAWVLRRRDRRGARRRAGEGADPCAVGRSRGDAPLTRATPSASTRPRATAFGQFRSPWRHELTERHGTGASSWDRWPAPATLQRDLTLPGTAKGAGGSIAFRRSP
jgi:hypothetical protein